MSTAVFNRKCILTISDNIVFCSAEAIICDTSYFDMEEPFFRVPKKTR